MRKGCSIVFGFIILSLILAIVVELAILPHGNPIRKSPDGIRDYVLSLTPIEMSKEDVFKIIDSKADWRLAAGSAQGVIFDSVIAGWPVAPGGRSIVGESHIIISLGTYRAISGFLIEREVRASLAFDAEGKLIDVHVQKLLSL